MRQIFQALAFLVLAASAAFSSSTAAKPNGNQAAAPGQVTALTGARILTVTQGEIARGTILIRNGKIAAVGENIDVPQGAAVIDVTGCTITPGLIDSHSHLGLGPSGGVTEDNEGSDPVTPQLRIIDSIHPGGMGPDRNQFRNALREGVTTVIARPGSGNVIGGQSAVIKLYGDTVDDMVVKFPADMKMAMGRKGGYASKGKMPVTKMGTAYLVRKAMLDAGNYKESLARYERKKAEDPDAVPPPRNLKDEAMLKVLDRELPVHIHASSADDIMTAVRLADEFKFSRLSIAHGVESYKIAPELARRGVVVVVGPQMITYDDKGNLINLADYLVKHGVTINIMTDADVVQEQFLRFQASIAIKYGLDPAEALKAITIHPAEIVGLDKRIGSIETGKDADLVIFSGDPFDIQTRVLKVFVNGTPAFEAQ